MFLSLLQVVEAVSKCSLKHVRIDNCNSLTTTQKETPITTKAKRICVALFPRPPLTPPIGSSSTPNSYRILVERRQSREPGKEARIYIQNPYPASINLSCRNNNYLSLLSALTLSTCTSSSGQRNALRTPQRTSSHTACIPVYIPQKETAKKRKKITSGSRSELRCYKRVH